MTLNTIIADLKKSGCNSKLKVIKKLEKPTLEGIVRVKKRHKRKNMQGKKVREMQFEVKGKICGKGRPRFVRRG